MSGKEKSALQVNAGIEQPAVTNSEAVKHFKSKKKKLPGTSYFVEKILNKDTTILSQAITLIESALPAHHQIAQEIIEKCLPHAGNSIRIGITGVPGVGKSTFIEALGNHITSKNNRLAVLAIDPSSERSKGSILGDKTRMETLSASKNAFIRPSPSAGSLGGVARKTRETIILCEAAGYNTIFIETVGVGQSETAVHSMVDFFLLLMLAGAGDELQGIKRGIMEMADTIAITKADGSNTGKSDLAKAEYANAVHLLPRSESKWATEVLTCSSVTGNGITNIWQTIERYKTFTTQNGYFESNRKKQAKYWMYETIDERLRNNFYHTSQLEKTINEFERKVIQNEISSFKAAQLLFDTYVKALQNK